MGAPERELVGLIKAPLILVTERMKYERWILRNFTLFDKKILKSKGENSNRIINLCMAKHMVIEFNRTLAKGSQRIHISLFLFKFIPFTRAWQFAKFTHVSVSSGCESFIFRLSLFLNFGLSFTDLIWNENIFTLFDNHCRIVRLYLLLFYIPNRAQQTIYRIQNSVEKSTHENVV